MYKGFFHLHSDPFNNSPDPRFLYRMPHTREALAALDYGICARKGFVVLTGEVGTGKTTLLRTALESLDQTRIFSSFVFNPRLEVLDFLDFVLHDFGITPAAHTKSSMLIQLNSWLIERFRNQEICVLIVDEAQNLSTELLEEIRLLTNLETSSQKLLQIVLCGQPELEQKLREPQLRQLRQRVSLWCRTQPLTPEQTAAYIHQRLLIAGATETIFSTEAVDSIASASGGIPRIVNLICEHALILAYVEQIRQIPPRIISTVVFDLELDTQPLLVSAGSRPARTEPGRHEG
jgi:general secretion pathway protein A